MDTRESQPRIGAISDGITSEEARALITVLWELASKMDKILSMFDRQSDDPRYKGDLYRPR